MNNICFVSPFKKATGGYEFRCVHEGSCATSGHEAAVRLLEKKMPINGVPFIESYKAAGMEFSITDVTGADFPPHTYADEGSSDDEVRILYWWGNSNLYLPVTPAEWQSELSAQETQQHGDTT